MSTSFNFVDYFVKYTAAAESPTDFFKWAALSGLSAIARDNVYLETDVVTVHPNIYVLLFAKSGVCKKSVPLKKILPIIKAVKNTTIIEGRTSLQWAISRLGKGTVGHNGEVITGASGLLYSEELSSLIVKDDNTIDYLTDLYDYHTEWNSGTHARGEEKLERVCLSILGATNEKLFRQVFTAEAIYGGLLGRTLIVQGSQARLKNSLMHKIESEYSDKPLIEHLFRVSRLAGPMTMAKNAAEYFHDWYMAQDFQKHDSETGLESRLTVHMLKVALLLSLAEERLDKIITLPQLQRAMEMVLSLVPNYRMLSTNIVNSEEQKQTVLIMQAVLKRGGQWISQAEIVRQHWFELDLKNISEIVEKLILGGMIEKAYGADNDPVYRASAGAIEQFLNNKGAQ